MDPTIIVTAAIYAMDEIQRRRAAGEKLSEEQQREVAKRHVAKLQSIHDQIEGELEEGG